MHVQHAVQGVVAVFVIIDALGVELRPAYVSRRGGMTYVFAHPSATIHDAMVWAQWFLTVEERNYIRREVGQPPIGESIDPALPDRTCQEVLDVPGLRLPVPRGSREDIRIRARGLREYSLRVRSDMLLRRALSAG